ASIAIAQQQAYTRDFTDIKDADGKSQFKPVVDKAQTGVFVDAQGTISADRKFVTLSLEARCSQLLALELVPFEKAPLSEKLMIQRPKMNVRTRDVIASIPQGSTLVLSDFRWKQGPYAEEGGDPKPLLLLLKPTIWIDPHGR